MTNDESVKYQLSEWVAGRPWHNTVRDECCPDFSCCQPTLLVPVAARIAFRDANREDRERMLFGFLSGAVDGLKVYVAGDPDIEKEGGGEVQ